jgi:hypothetical protein
MIRKHFPVLAFFSSILCFTLVGMQTQDSSPEDYLPYHRPQTPSPLKNEDHSVRIIMAASNADPESLSKLLFERRFDEGSLNLALFSARNTHYVHSWSPKIKTIENFFPKGLFESKKKACICLLEQALKMPVTLNTEAPNKKRD